MSQLFTKYHVRTPDEQPLDGGCFVLRPFNSDGTIRDPAAIAALKTYANFLPSAQRELRAEITDWVDTPGLSQATRELNVPPSVTVELHPQPFEHEGKWSLSTDEETYHGIFDSEQDAIDEGKATETGWFYVGKCMRPVQPEMLFDSTSVEDWIGGRVWDHEDYSGEWAEGEFSPTESQMAELAEQIKPVIAAWLDRQNLRTTFFVLDPQTVRRIAGK